MSDLMYRQEYEADFVTFQGAVYGDRLFNQVLRTDAAIKTLIPEWPDIASWRTCYIGLDTGADHPTGAVKFILTENALVAVDEYLERDRSFAEHVAEWKRLARPHQNIHWVINKNERQPMLELARLGINCEPAENDQFAGTERVKTWLHNKQLWFVESRVPRTVKQMMALRYAGARRDGQTREKMEVYKKNDELPDVVRYVAMAFPQFSEAPKTVMQRNISNFDDATQEQIQRMRRITAQERSSDEEVAESFW